MSEWKFSCILLLKEDLVLHFPSLPSTLLPSLPILFTSAERLISRKWNSLPYNKLSQGQLVAHISNSAFEMLPVSLHLFLGEARAGQEIKASRICSRKRKGRLPTQSMKVRALILSPTLICACHSWEGDEEIALNLSWPLSGVIP